ncbi:MAG: neutral/alkaline non-lysosomal ceramidase N-terminal domain-containing protein [Gammaproteobacteria bacterium]|nr:neutral/alkaline non-lysosomal ceramidase N-terminal domain-containing protein [Gammaproteobacteria bacterium]MDH5304466.1 neutral/alkaline non-lysosomal ceramidase N-terminal domain-containing protein [Gammaproteobacteria bacterium]
MNSQRPAFLLTAFLLAAITAPGALAQSGQDGLRVAATRVDITHGTEDVRPSAVEYEHERLYLRAIVIDNGASRAVLIGADLGGIADEVWDDASKRIAAKLNIPVANIIISSTHTHSDTPASETPGPGVARFGTDFVADVALQAVTDAMQRLEPALMGYSTGEAYLNVNRDAVNPDTHLWTQATNLDGSSDKTVAVVSFVRPDGTPVAAYVNYAMHPVSGYLAGFQSGDFAGATSRYVEQAFGDRMVTVFSQGASGDQNPRWLRTGTNAMASRSGAAITGYEMVREDIEAPLRSRAVAAKDIDPEIKRQLAGYMQAQGIILGEEVIRVMSDTEHSAVAAEIWGKQTMLTCPGRRRLDSGREGMAGEYEDGDDVGIRLGVLAIGDIAFGTAAGEIYSKIGLRVKQESPLSKTLLVTLANGRGTTGYVPDDESFGHRTFQVLGTRLKPGCAESGIASAIASLLGEYLAQ